MFYRKFVTSSALMVMILALQTSPIIAQAESSGLKSLESITAEEGESSENTRKTLDEITLLEKEEGVEEIEDSITSENSVSFGEMADGRDIESQLYYEAQVIVSTPENVPNGNPSCRSQNITYMSYEKITLVSSNQYIQQHSDECYTDKTTGIRCVDDRYCIAVGSYYSANVGDKLDVVFEDGTIIRCIVGDCKSDAHTDENHQFQKYDGSVVEFLVDYEYFSSTKQWKGIIGEGDIVKVVKV